MGGIDVILLAAGRSSRLGQPKALVDVDGQPLIQRLMNRLHQLNAEVTVVTNTDFSQTSCCFAHRLMCA